MVRRENSADIKKKKTWAVHPNKEMVLLSQKELAMVLGTVVEMEPMSRRARLRRKKYMGVWRRWSQTTALMMRLLLRRAARQMPRKRQKCRSCSSLVSADAMKRNSVMELLLDMCCFWAWGPVHGGKDSQKLWYASLSTASSISHRNPPDCLLQGEMIVALRPPASGKMPWEEFLFSGFALLRKDVWV